MKTKLHHCDGFTLVEIMIVVAIIGLLAAIAIPSFYSARKNAQTKSCINNLRQISAAKDQWALDYKQASGEPSLDNDLVVYFIKRLPVCPAGGNYNVNELHTNPECTAFDADNHPAQL